MPPEELRRILERLNILLGLKEERQGAGDDALTAELAAIEAEAREARGEPPVDQPTPQESAAARRLFGRRYDPNNAQDIRMAERLVDEVWREVRARSFAQGITPPPADLARDAIARALIDETRSLGTVLAHTDPALNILNQVIADKERLELGPHPEAPIFGMKFNQALNAARDSGRISQLQFDFIKNPSRAEAIPTSRDAELGITVSTLERDAIEFVEELKTNMPRILAETQTLNGDFTTAAARVFRAESDEDIAQGRALLPPFGQTDAQVRLEQQAGALGGLFESENLAKAANAVLDSTPGLQSDPLNPNPDVVKGRERAANALVLALEREQAGGASADELAAFAQDWVSSGRFLQDFSTAVENIERDRATTEAEKAVPTTVAEGTKLFGEALAQQGVFGLEKEALFRGGLQTFRAGEVPEDAVLQGIADFRIQEQQAGQAEALKGTQALTTSDRNLNAFVFGKLRDEGVFSRTSSPEFIQSIEQDILPGVAQEVAEILETSPFSDPNAAFATAFENLATPREPTFGAGLTERDFERQMGITGIDLRPAAITSAARREREERGALPGADELSPLFSEAAGESPAFLQHLFGQAEDLQQRFLSARREDVREQRGGLQREGVEASRGLAPLRGAFAAVGGETGPGGEAIGADIARIRQNISGISAAQRGARSNLTFGDFFSGELGSLRKTFGESPAGLQESQRLTRQAESDRRRRLRGGRTMFERTFG